MTDMKTKITRHLDAAFEAHSDTNVVPIILLYVPGVGVANGCSAYAVERSIQIVEVRCAQMDARDFKPLPRIVDGEVVYSPHSVRVVREMVTSGSPSLMLLDDAASNDVDVAASMLAQVAREATSRVVVPMMVLHSQIDDAYKAIAKGLGLLPHDVTVHVVANEGHFIEEYVAYARANGVDETILSMIETKKDFMGGTPQGWTQYSALRQGDDFEHLDRKTREAIAVGMVGQKGYDALMQWIRTGQ